MNFKIYIILFGLSFTNGKPSRRSSFLINSENDVQNAIKALVEKGKFDLALTHTEDSPKSHHEDKARFIRHDEIKRHHRSDANSRHSRHHYGSNRGSFDQNPSLTNIENFNLNSNNLERNQNDGKPSYAQIDDILDIIDHLERQLDEEDGNTISNKGRNNYRKERSRNKDDNEYNANNNDNYRNRDDDQELRSRNDRDDDRRDDRDDDDDNDNDNDRNDDVNDNRNEIADIINDFRDNNKIENDRGDVDDRDANSRCKGESCKGTNALRERVLNNDLDFWNNLVKGKKVKINNELDAIVVDLDNLRTNADQSRDGQQQNVLNFFNNFENVENNNDQEPEKANRQTIQGASNPNSVVVDLSRVQDGLADDISDLVTNLQQAHSKQYSFMNEHSYSEPRIMSHNENNNNVYVPQWLLEEVVSKVSENRQSAEIAEETIKNILPLSPKQRARLARAIEKKKMERLRRSAPQDFGLPFHMEVEGLGQANP